MLLREKVINKHADIYQFYLFSLGSLEPPNLNQSVFSVSFSIYVLIGLGLPDQVENMCPLLPSLEQALGEVEELAGAGAGACQAHYIHVTEVTLPMLCSYMSLWWYWGPEGQRDSPICTSVIPQHASNLLGHILRIIHNHVGTSQGDWMKQMAGIVVMSNIGGDFFISYQVCILFYFSPTINSCHVFQFILSQSYAKPALSS